MDSIEDNPQLAALMAEMSWLRRLAYALLRDADGADDVAQDTWLAAAQHPPTAAPLRPWLGRVALNLVRGRARAEQRRTAREQVVGEAADPVRTPEELVRRIEIQRLVADEVVRLAEPYRSTILLHYFEELTSAQIARRLGVPEGTVRRRLKVALDQLRDRLGARDPKRARALVIALGPLAKQAPPKSASVTVIGVIVMKKIIAALAIMLVVLVAAVWYERAATKNRDHTSAVVRGGDARPPIVHERDDIQVPTWFSPRGVGLRAIAGRVTFEGKPVAGAVVGLHDMLTKAGVRPPIERRTGPDGKFDFGAQPAGYFDVVASSPDRTAALVRLNLADPTLKPAANNLELRLGGCIASVTGTVFDASGGVIPQAQVSRDGLVGAFVDDKGAYELCLPRGDSQVKFAADGYGAVMLTFDAQGAIHQDVVLVPEATIFGRVVRADDGQPVANVYIGITAKQPGRDGPADAYVVSGADGRFRVAGLVPGRYRVWGMADDVILQNVDVIATLGDGHEVTLIGTAMTHVRGFVMSAGEPVAGATVLATLTASPHRSDVAISQTDGSFVLERVPIGDVSFSASPYRVVAPAHFDVTASQQPVRIEVDRLATIRGRVTRLGVPVAGATVCCARTISSRHFFYTDSDGNYEIAGVLPGTHRIAATNEELGTMMDSIAVAIAAGEERTQDLEMDLAATISGIVVDQHGQPVKGVFVKWTNEKTGDLGRSITDGQGRYRCSAMTGGAAYRASVFATSALQAAYRTADGAPYPVVDLRDGKSVVDGARIAVEVREVSIAGRVVDGVGEPVVDATVKAMAMSAGQSPAFNSWMKLPLTVTDKDGAFKIGGLTQGTYALWAGSPDGGDGIASNVVAGETAATITVVRPGVIQGKLVDFPAVPFVQAATLVPDATYVEASDTTTSSFRIGGLRPGRYLVTAQTAHEGAAQIVDVKSGPNPPVVLTAGGRGTIECSVLDFKTRAPIAGAACHVLASADGMHGTTGWDARIAPRTDAHGRVVLDPAPAGPGTVSCMMPSTQRSTPSADVVLAPGGRASVQLLSAETTLDYPSTIGVDFDWRITAARIAVVRISAANTGLLVGDLVIAVDGVSMTGLNGEGVRNIIDNRASGSDVSVTVLRGSQRKTFNLKTEPREL